MRQMIWGIYEFYSATIFGCMLWPNLIIHGELNALLHSCTIRFIDAQIVYRISDKQFFGVQASTLALSAKICSHQRHLRQKMQVKIYIVN
jgi:hypothetical protein